MCKILIVEDSRVDTVFIKKELDGSTYEIQSVVSENEFKSIIRRESFDLIITDYFISNEFTAESIMEYLLKIGKIDIPVIVISSKIGEEAAVNLMKLGVRDFVYKSAISKLSSVVEREIVDKIHINKMNNILINLVEILNWIIEKEIKNVLLSDVVSRFGTIFNASKCYIFKKENQFENVIFTKDFHWQDDKCDLSDVTLNVSTIDNGILLNRILQDQGFALKEDVLETNPSIRNLIPNSLVFSSIFTPEGKLWGFFGLENCILNNRWTETEVSAVKLIGATIGTLLFIMDKYAKEDLLLKNLTARLKELE